MSPVDKLYKKLASADDDVWAAGMKHAEKLPRALWRMLADLLARDYPHDSVVRHTKERLLRQLGYLEPSGLVSTVEEIYDHLSEELRNEALRTLMDLTRNKKAARAAVVRLLGRPTSIPVELCTAIFIPLRETPRDGLDMLPGLLEVLPRLNDRGSLYLVVLAYAKAGLLELRRFPGFRRYCSQRLRHVLRNEAACNVAKDTPAEVFSPVYLAYVELPYLLDVLRLVGGGQAVQLLREVVQQRRLFPWLKSVETTHLKLMAACSLLALGQPVAPRLLLSVARTPDLRWRLWHQLETVSCLDSFPRRYLNQRDLAEAEMVEWLEHPMEVGGPPEQIELLTVFSHSPGQDGYLFKFRYPGNAWQVGMAGPYPSAGPPRLGGANTFSIFKKLQKKSLAGHVRDYLPEE